MDRCTKLSEKVYRMDLHYGSFTPKEGTLLNIFYIVDFEKNIDFIRNEAKQMLLEIGVSYIGIYGRESKPWYETFIEEAKSLGLRTDAILFNAIEEYTNKEVFVNEIKKAARERSFVPTEIYIISDSTETEKEVLNAIKLFEE